MPSKDSIYEEEVIPSQFTVFWRELFAHNITKFSIWMLLAIIVICLFAPWIVPFDPQILSLEHQLLPPSWALDGEIEYFLGTDNLGRDLLSQIIIGLQTTLDVSFSIALLVTIIGTPIGIIAGMTKGLLSSVLNHFLDTIMSIPSILMAIILIVIFDDNYLNLILAIVLALLPSFIRTIYICVSTEMKKDYILAARLDGANNLYLLRSAILPNLSSVLVTEITLSLTSAIFNITAVGFLNFTKNIPMLELGAIVGTNTSYLYLAPWTVVLPGMAILIVTANIFVVGSAISRALNVGFE